MAGGGAASGGGARQQPDPLRGGTVEPVELLRPGVDGREPRGPEPHGPVDVGGEPMLTLEPDGVPPRRGSPRDRRTPRPARVSAAVEAFVAAGAGLLVLPGLGQLQRQVLVHPELGGGFFVLGVLLSVGAAFAAAAGAHRWLGGGRRRDAAAVGVVAAALAGTAWGAVTISGGWAIWEYLPPRTVLWAAALASVVLAVRTAGVGARLAGSFAGVMAALAITTALQSGWPLLSAYGPSQPSAPPAETAEAPPTAEAPATHEPQEDPASPTFGDLCHPDELEVGTTTPVPGGHDVATTITAVNVGGRDCRVEGWPSLDLLSGGESLALTVHVSQTQPGGDHVDEVPVVLAPGEAATTQVWWPAWGAAADLDATQELRIGVGGGTEVVDLPAPDRWDVVRSAEAWVAPWQPAEER